MTAPGPARRRGLRLWHPAALVLVAAGLLAASRASGCGPRDVVFWTVAFAVPPPFFWVGDHLAPRLRDHLEENDWMSLGIIVGVCLPGIGHVVGIVVGLVAAIYLSSLFG